jgi:Tfp pilus assembly protein PilF
VLQQALVALDEGRYEEAAEKAREAMRVDPLVAEAYAVAGRAAAALGDDAAALEPLRKAVFLEPGCAEAHFTLAGVLQRTGQSAAAAAAYRAAGAAVVTTNAERLQRMLDGRDPASLAALCEQLAQAAERSADAYAAGGA